MKTPLKNVLLAALCLPTVLLAACSGVYAEPSATDMLEALGGELSSTGLEQPDKTSVVIRNSLNGVEFRINDFSKGQCNRAKDGPGYMCSFTATYRTKAIDQEGTQEGRDYTDTVTQFLNLIGGTQTVSETRRFTKVKNKWTVETRQRENY